MTLPNITVSVPTVHTPAPSRTQGQEDFDTNADAFLSSLTALPAAINQVAGQMNTQASYVNDLAVQVAETAQDLLPFQQVAIDYKVIFLGIKSTLPVVDNDGLPLTYGAMCTLQTDGVLYVYMSSGWQVFNSAAIASLTEAYKNSAQASASLSESARDAAQAARDAAQLSSGVYQTTAAGLAATVSGRYFSVPSANNDESLVLYLNNAGAAQLVKAYPSVDFVAQINRRITEQAEILPSDNIDIAFALLDSNNRIAFYVDSTGRLVPKKILLPSSTSFADDPLTPISNRLLPSVLQGSIYEESGAQYAFALVDQNDKIKFAVPFQGSLIGKIQKAELADSVASGGVTYDSLDTYAKTLISDNRFFAETIGANLYVFNRVTGKRVLISTNSATNARIIDGSFIVYTEGTTQFYKPVGGGTANQLISTNRLVTWGDSLTAATNGVSAAASYLGYTGLNRGQAGYRVIEIAIRQGGVKAVFSVAGN